MLSIQEAVQKTEKQIRQVATFMDSHNYFDAQQCNIYEGLKRSTQRELSETLRNCRLRDLLKGLSKKQLREFLLSGMLSVSRTSFVRSQVCRVEDLFGKSGLPKSFINRQVGNSVTYCVENTYPYVSAIRVWIALGRGADGGARAARSSAAEKRVPRGG